MRRAACAAGALVVLAMAPSACTGDDIVEVTGSTGQCYETNTEWIGDPSPGVLVPGRELTRTITCPDKTMSDARLSGETVFDIRCEFVLEDGQTIGICAKEGTTTNDGGTWEERGGDLRIIVGNPSEVVEEGVQVGTGDYDGLQFDYTTGGTAYPWPITGTLKPVD